MSLLNNFDEISNTQTSKLPSIQQKSNYKIKLSWRNIAYSIKSVHSKSEMKRLGLHDQHYEKEVLKTQSGYVKSGETMFIMGSSGAGKTTLLNALSDRLNQDRKHKLEGSVMINDTYPLSQDDFGTYGAYVMQTDIMFPTLTCEEVLRFSAQLKTNLKGRELDRKIEEVINIFSLNKCRKTYIGDGEIKGLRPGDKKKTAIATQFITDPAVLFLDEPTSGLDSFTALKIVELLVKQSRKDKTIIATIHQPNSSAFSLFDRLYLLMDGHLIYQGYAKEAANYFEKLDFIIPTFSNPADYFLKEFYIPYERGERDDRKLKTLFEGYFKNLDKTIMDEDVSIEYEQINHKILKESHYIPGWCKEMCLLTERTGKNIYRNPASTKIRIIQIVTMIILMN